MGAEVQASGYTRRAERFQICQQAPAAWAYEEMKRTSYIDSKGRQWAVLLPEAAPESDAPLGLHVGPPSLAALDWPEPLEIALHNQLFARGLLTYEEARRGHAELMAAIQGALKLDVGRLVEVYFMAQNGHTIGNSLGQEQGVLPNDHLSDQ